jgi:hypothetical protein
LHLRGDGGVETTAEMEERLLRLTGVGAAMLGGLFAEQLSAGDRGEYLAEAYRRQAQRRAYRLPAAPGGATE